MASRVANFLLLVSVAAKDCHDGSPCFGGDCCCGTPKSHPETCLCKDHEASFVCCGCAWCTPDQAWCWNGTPGGNPICGGCNDGQTCDFSGGGDATTGFWPSLDCKDKTSLIAIPELYIKTGAGNAKVTRGGPPPHLPTTFAVAEPKKPLGAGARTGATYYEKPVNGTCSGPGEIDAEISGVDGSFCSPNCEKQDCPDAPAGVTALPECALQPQGASDPTNCMLACGGAAKCPRGSTCTTIVPGSMYAGAAAAT